MISIDHLWIPIVLSAVLIFVASSLIGNARGQVLRNRITVRIRYCKT